MGIDSARAVNEALKKDVNNSKANENKAMENAQKSLSVIGQNSELAKMFNESAKVGAENLGSSLPMLKIHTANKSLGNTLANGEEPNDGWFFYTQTQEQFKEIICHVLTISKGFRAEGMMDKTTGKKRENVFNQILGGVIVNDNKTLPFIFYFTGTKLANMWEFAKEAGKYTNAKPVSVPMFALTVKLTTEKVENSYGFSKVVKFEIVKNEFGVPVVVSDVGKFVFLKEMVESVETTIDSLIASKSTEEVVQDAKVYPTEENPFNPEEVANLM